MIICDMCDCGFHTYCLEPRLMCLPSEDDDWYCPACDEHVDFRVKYDEKLVERFIDAETVDFADTVSSVDDKMEIDESTLVELSNG